jgi:photosystem II Psb27 protein
VTQTKVLEQVQQVLDLDKKDPSKEGAVKELRKEINTWVANYRREAKVAGRPSFG